MPTTPTRSVSQRTKLRLTELETDRQPWVPYWDTLREYVQSKKSIDEAVLGSRQGESLNRDLFDATGVRASGIAASALLAMLWPQSTRRFRLSPPHGMRVNAAVKKFYESMTEGLTRVLDNPRAGLLVALDEYMNEQMVSGTSGIEITGDPKTRLRFRAWGAATMMIDEGADGYVNTVCLVLRLTGRQIQELYDDLPSEVRDGIRNREGDKRTVKMLIYPRTAGGAARAKPWVSEHIDVATGTLLKESGFDELPIKVCRFKKHLGEVYGRSPAMDALPDILNLDAMSESVLLAEETRLKPPLGLLDDGRLGGGEINTSPGAVTVFNNAGRVGDQNPIFPLFTVGEASNTVQLMERMTKSINDHFSVDRLLNFNNETQMTLGEAQIRLRLQNATLRSIFARQIAELFNPLIDRAFNLLLDSGYIGRDLPVDLRGLKESGEDIYQIEYFTPATRIMQAEEAESIMRTWEFLGTAVAPLSPSAIDVFDADVAVRRFREIVGAPSEMERDEGSVDTIRQTREQEAQKAAEMQQVLAGSEAARNIGQSNLPGLSLKGG